MSDARTSVPVSRRTLERRYRKAFGITPKQAIQRVRMIRACSLLSNTGLTVAEVAYGCGFADRVRFTLEFHKQHKMPPSRYRKMHQRLK